MIACPRRWRLHGNLKTACFFVLAAISASSLAPAQSADGPDPATSIFKEKCITCHGEDGAGTALGNRLHVKDLRTGEIQEKSNKELADTITAGKGLMPAFGTRLDSDQIQKLVEFIRLKKPKTQ